MTNEAEDAVKALLVALELVAILAALALVLAALVATARRFLAVRRPGVVLVLPFQGNDEAAHAVTGSIAKRLPSLEERWRELSAGVASREDDLRTAKHGSLHALGASTRTKTDTLPAPGQIEALERDAISDADLGTISFGGASFSPRAIVALFQWLGERGAKRTLRGTVYRFGDTVRIAATYTPARDAEGDASSPFTRSVEAASGSRTVFDLVDDLAFELAKGRLGSLDSTTFSTHAATWAAYEAFLVAHRFHLDFLTTGERVHRERAVLHYERALAREPSYYEAHYNLAALLYNRYLPEANAAAIDHYGISAGSDDDELRALSLAGLAMAYGQNVHRFCKGRQPWAARADATSAEALAIQHDLEETRFARGWAHQVCQRWEDAVRQYEAVAKLDGTSPKELQLKSFALNNAGYVVLTELHDVERADALLQRALVLYRNKMTYAVLAEIAKGEGRYDDAAELLQQALLLDSNYVNALNELSLVHLARAAAARDDGDDQRKTSALREASTMHERALVHVEDDAYRAQLAAAFAGDLGLRGFAAAAP